VAVPAGFTAEGRVLETQKRPNVKWDRQHGSSYGIELADQGAVAAESELSGLVLSSNEGNLAAEVANLVLGDSKLHKGRVDLNAEELDGTSRHSLDLVRVH
jgi:hypothetical protein